MKMRTIVDRYFCPGCRSSVVYYGDELKWNATDLGDNGKVRFLARTTCKVCYREMVIIETMSLGNKPSVFDRSPDVGFTFKGNSIGHTVRDCVEWMVSEENDEFDDDALWELINTLAYGLGYDDNPIARRTLFDTHGLDENMFSDALTQLFTELVRNNKPCVFGDLRFDPYILDGEGIE